MVSGFTTMFIYRYLKLKIREVLNLDRSSSWVYFVSSSIANIFACATYFPIELIKIRMQTKNDVFGYYSLLDGLTKEIRLNGIPGLYRGFTPYAITWSIFSGLAFLIYEKIMNMFRVSYGEEDYMRKQFWFSTLAAFISGIMSSYVTNCLEVVSVNKQTNYDATIAKIVKQQGLQLFTRGAGIRVIYYGAISMLYFNLNLGWGRLFNVDLTE